MACAKQGSQFPKADRPIRRGGMFAEIKKEVELVLAHFLFIDIVEYSKILINDQLSVLCSVEI